MVLGLCTFFMLANDDWWLINVEEPIWESKLRVLSEHATMDPHGGQLCLMFWCSVAVNQDSLEDLPTAQWKTSGWLRPNEYSKILFGGSRLHRGDVPVDAFETLLYSRACISWGYLLILSACEVTAFWLELVHLVLDASHGPCHEKWEIIWIIW